MRRVYAVYGVTPVTRLLEQQLKARVHIGRGDALVRLGAQHAVKHLQLRLRRRMVLKLPKN